MKYQVSTIGDCIKDIFVIAPSEVMTKGYFGSAKKYLSFPYGDKITIQKVEYDLGGSACNGAITFSRLGFKAALSTIVGGDIYSREALEILKKEKISNYFVFQEKGSSLGFSIILTGPDGDRTILVHRVEKDYTNINVGKIFEASEVIYVAGINKYSKILQKKILAYTVNTKKPLFLNPSSYQIKEGRRMLVKMISRSTGVCMNYVEALAFVRKKKMRRKDLLSTIHRIGTGFVIITMGSRGALFYDGTDFYKIGIYKMKVKDSAGSGDAFFATYIAGRMKGESTEDSLKLAAINSGHVASVYGAQKGLLRWGELKEKLGEGKVKITNL